MFSRGYDLRFVKFFIISILWELNKNMTRVYDKSPTNFIINFKLMLQISMIFFSFDSILYREFQIDFFL